MDYFRSKRFLDSLYDWETGRPAPGDVELNLPRMRALLARLDNPQKHFRSVIVGGTNGKGTVSSLLASLLLAGGYPSGLYTSPHLHTVRERIQLDSEPVAKEVFAEAASLLYDHTRGFEAEGLGMFTRFEALTGLAAWLFACHGVEFGVFEVGLGGRYDATNAWDSELAVLTAVDVDHAEILGPDPVTIAGDKLHIARPGRPLFTTAAQLPAVMARIRDEAVARSLTLHVIPAAEAESADNPRAGGLLALPDRSERPSTYRENARLALAVAAHLAGTRLDAAVANDVVARHQWPGRFERARRRPLVILDGAHNPKAARRLAADLQTLAPCWTLVIGVGRGHEADGILAALAPVARRLVLTCSDHPKALDPSALAASVPAGMQVETAATCRQALARIMEQLDEGDACCVTGSLHLVACAREFFDLPMERDGITEDVALESLVCVRAACANLGLACEPVSADGNVLRVSRGDRILHFLRNKNPFNDYVAGRLAEDKGYQYELFTRHGVPVPQTMQVFNPLADARFDRYKTHPSVSAIVADAEQALKYPLVVKKYRSSLGQGVSLEPDRLSLERRLEFLFENSGYTDNIVLLQEYVPGPEYRMVASQADMLLAYAKVSACRSDDLNPLHQADGQAVPVADPRLLARLEGLTRQVAAVVQLGFFAIDVIDGPDGLRVLEINPNPFCYFYNRSNGRQDFVRVYERLLQRYLALPQ